LLLPGPTLFTGAAGRVDDDVLLRCVGIVLPRPQGSDEPKRCAFPPELRRLLLLLAFSEREAAAVRCFTDLAI